MLGASAFALHSVARTRLRFGRLGTLFMERRREGAT